MRGQCYSSTESSAVGTSTSCSSSSTPPSYGGFPDSNEAAEAAEQDTAGRVSSLDAYFALVKGNLGPGVLALPFAFSQAGWACGLPVLLVVVAQGVYAMLVLAECKQAVKGLGVTDLGDMARIALGPCGSVAADVFVFVVQGGVCCCFVNLVAGNLTESIGLVSRRAMTLILAPFFAAVALLRFVAQLGFLNKLGSVAMTLAIVVGTICGVSHLNEVGYDTFLRRALPYRPFSDSIMLASSVFFAFEGLGIVIPIEKEMARPLAFPRVASLAALTLAAAFICVSLTCGIAYRGELQSGSIVAFLAAQPGSGPGHVIVQVADHLVTAAVFFTYPLQLLPASEILESWTGISSSAKAEGSGADAAADEPRRASVLPAWVLCRLALVCVTVVTALAADNVTLLTALFGSVGQTGLGMLAPLCHLALVRSGALAGSAARTVLDVAIVAFCAVIMVSGTYLALMDILAHW